MLQTVSFMKVLPSFIPFVNGYASRFPVHHREDLCQEGLLGLYRACQTYDETTSVPFDAYAKVCIKNRMLTSYRLLCRDDGTEELTEETEPLPREDATDLTVTRVFFDQLRESLSDTEKTVLDEYLKDKTYGEMTEKTGLSEKQIDNALTRIKQKIKLLYNN